MKKHASLAKRVLDLAVAGTALVLTSPLLATVAVAIKLDSPGPILFRQVRVGRDRRPITTLKLRTMVIDAERSGPQVTAGNDPRITRLGRWLRRTKLDELPQLWNVVRGDMSLVGPRPEVPRYVEGYRPEWEQLFSALPGLTDLASLVFRDEEHLLAAALDRELAYREVIMPLKLQLAVEELEKSSVAHDLRIMFQTIAAIAGVRGARAENVIAETKLRIQELNRSVRPS